MLHGGDLARQGRMMESIVQNRGYRGVWGLLLATTATVDMTCFLAIA